MRSLEIVDFVGLMDEAILMMVAVQETGSVLTHPSVFFVFLFFYSYLPAGLQPQAWVLQTPR